jgi:hypothetical protein
MNTTTILVEHLISGVQAMIWFILLTLSVFGFEWINLEKLKGFETILSFVALVFAYPLGVFIDNLSDILLLNKSKKIKLKHIKNEKLNVGYVLDKASTPLGNYFTYTRMRIRIGRVTFINFILVTMMLVIFTKVRLSQYLLNSVNWVIFWEITTGIFMIAFAFWNWNSITNTFYEKAAKEIEKHGIDIPIL